MSTPLILDCDPGHDDALAIMLAAAHPAVDLKAITTVAGNQTLDKTTLNARRVCTLAGITDVPVAAGCDRPLSGVLEIAADVHGESGLDGPVFGPPTVPLAEEHAVDLMHRVLVEGSEPTTIVAVGPLTNVATLLRRHPEDVSRIRELVVMGGSTSRGNHTPYAEFNIYVDPEAAAEVLASGLPITFHGLNVTHQALVTPDVVARFRGMGTQLGEVCAELMTFFASTYRRLWDFPAPPLHDPVAVAYVIDRSVVDCVRAPVRIEVEGAHTRGATVVDLHGRMGWAPNADVGLTLHRDRFWELMTGAVEHLGRA
ncbi:nucleoside hydrolase [Nonomuraea sp. NPDC059194]|uniref:nucleoside hydrolase n=1 Tax=Nonomuraea sp. NPDC059194 TaxID=3346764 RepID=UPI0036A5D01B